MSLQELDRGEALGPSHELTKAVIKRTQHIGMEFLRPDRPMFRTDPRHAFDVYKSPGFDVPIDTEEVPLIGFMTYRDKMEKLRRHAIYVAAEKDPRDVPIAYDEPYEHISWPDQPFQVNRHILDEDLDRGLALVAKRLVTVELYVPDGRIRTVAECIVAQSVEGLALSITDAVAAQAEAQAAKLERLQALAARRSA